MQADEYQIGSGIVRVEEDSLAELAWKGEEVCSLFGWRRGDDLGRFERHRGRK